MTVRNPSIVLLCLLMAACADGPCQAPVAIADLSLLPSAGLVIMPASIGGTAIGLRIDTGAQFSILSTSAVERFAVDRLARGRASGIGGAAEEDYVRLPDLLIGGQDLQAGIFGVSSSAVYNASLKPADGMVGMDVLANWDVDLDVGDDRLRLYRRRRCASPAPPWVGAWQSVALIPSRYGKILVPASLDGHRVTAELNSGDAPNVVSQVAYDPPRSADGPDPAVSITGFGNGVERGRLHQVGHLRIAGQDYGSLPIVVSSLPSRSRGDDDALLGADFLRTHRIFVMPDQGVVFIAPSGDRARSGS